MHDWQPPLLTDCLAVHSHPVGPYAAAPRGGTPCEIRPYAVALREGTPCEIRPYAAALREVAPYEIRPQTLGQHAAGPRRPHRPGRPSML